MIWMNERREIKTFKLFYEAKKILKDDFNVDELK